MGNEGTWLIAWADFLTDADLYNMDIILQAAVIVGVMISVAFVVSIVIDRNDIADVLWGAYPATVAVYFWITQETSQIQGLIYSLVILWGIRLAIHIGSRNSRKGEDPRYAQWREDWGRWFYVRSFVQVYVLQGILSLLVMTPVLVAAHYDYFSFNIFVLIGLVIWFVGFIFETVGDYQLRQFISNPGNKGKIMMEGLWRYTRHPNYFGEVTMWWGIFAIIAGAYGCIYGIISPIVITILILGVSGIPMTERRYKGNVVFDRYKERTNAFFPGPPKG